MKTRNRRYLGSSGMDRDKSEDLGKTFGDYPTYWQNLGRSVENEIPYRLGIPDTDRKTRLRRHDGDENERKSNRLNRQNKKAARTSRFFFQLHFFAVTTRFRTFYGGRKQVTTKFFFSLWTWMWLLGIRLQKSSLAFDKERELKESW